MSSAPLETRVSALDQALLELVRAQARTQVQLDQLSQELARAQAHTQVQLDQLSQEMRVFKDEMVVFKDEMVVFRDEMVVFRDGFRDEMRVFKDEMRLGAERTYKQLGELSNRMGTLVEDILAPSLPQVFRRLFGPVPGPESGLRVRRLHQEDPSREREFDAVAWGGGFLLVAEVKSTLRPRDIPDFVAVLSEARAYLSEAQGRKVVGSLASFFVDPSLVSAGEREGLLMLGLSRNLVEILNRPDFKPREF